MNIPIAVTKNSTEPRAWTRELDAKNFSPPPMYLAAGENSTEPQAWTRELDTKKFSPPPVYLTEDEYSTEPRAWTLELDTKNFSPPPMYLTEDEYSTEPRAWTRELDATDEPWKVLSMPIVYGFVLGDATEKIRRIDHVDQTELGNATASFSDGQVLIFLGSVTEFASINKSEFDAGEPNPVMMKQLDQLIAAAHNEFFEVGIESQFSRDLQRLFQFDSPLVVQYLTTKLKENYTNSEVLAEILRWASRHEACSVHALVIDLLSAGLNHISSLVRDEAALGLAYLDETAALALAPTSP